MRKWLVEHHLTAAPAAAIIAAPRSAAAPGRDIDRFG